MCRGNSRSRVSHLDDCLAGVHPTHFDGYCATIRSVFYPIVYQIHEGVTHESGIRCGMNFGRSFEREVLLLFVSQYADLIDNIPRQGPKVQCLWHHLQLSGVSARKDQKALDKPGEPVDLFQHTANDIAIRGRLKCVA